MKDINEICVIIQARLGSQRVPNKMLKPFAGTTLTDIALEKTKRCAAFPIENFYFSVYEQELASVGERHGVNVFSRSRRSAQSEGTPIGEMYEWWDQLDYRYCVLINACFPFLKAETIDDFVNTYRVNESEGLFGVIEKRTYYWDANHRPITPWPEGHQAMNTKFVAPTYEAAHCLYAGRTDSIGKGYWMGSFHKEADPTLYIMEEVEALDIDYAWQFEACEALYRSRGKRVGSATP